MRHSIVRKTLRKDPIAEKSRRHTLPKSLILPILLSALAGCTTTSGKETKVEILPTIEQDSKYEKARQAASRSTTVTKNFETKFIIDVTYLSPEFRSAFAKRAERFTKNKMQFLDENSERSAFFVSIFAPESRVDDLADPNYWTIQLTNSEKTIRPAFVRRLAEKTRWKNFFPAVSNWSSEYMIVFDTPTRSTTGAEMAETNRLQVQFTTPEADVTMNW